MVTVRFREVAIRGTHRWKDTEGKWHQQTRRFWQTLSPFNRDADGDPKSAAQIMAEIQQERIAWLGERRRATK